MNTTKKFRNFMTATNGSSYGFLIEAFALFDNREHLDPFSLALMDRRFKVTVGIARDKYGCDLVTLYECYQHIFNRSPSDELKQKLKENWE